MSGTAPRTSMTTEALHDRTLPHVSWGVALEFCLPEAEGEGATLTHLWVGDNVVATLSVDSNVARIELPERATQVGDNTFRLALYEEET